MDESDSDADDGKLLMLLMDSATEGLLSQCNECSALVLH